MRKIKYKRFITRKDLDNIILSCYPDYKCPECSRIGVYAGCIEDQYDERKMTMLFCHLICSVKSVELCWVNGIIQNESTF